MTNVIISFFAGAALTWLITALVNKYSGKAQQVTSIEEPELSVDPCPTHDEPQDEAYEWATYRNWAEEYIYNEFTNDFIMQKSKYGGEADGMFPDDYPLDFASEAAVNEAEEEAEAAWPAHRADELWREVMDSPTLLPLILLRAAERAKNQTPQAGPVVSLRSSFECFKSALAAGNAELTKQVLVQIIDEHLAWADEIEKIVKSNSGKQKEGLGDKNCERIA
jgi:hypothetical protein